MLLANRRVAEFCGKRKTDKAAPSNVDGLPRPRLAERGSWTASGSSLRFGHIFKATKGRAVAKELGKLFAQIKGTTEENAVSTMAVRSMAKA